MNPEIKAKWIADLRSGEFQQGQRRLAKIQPDGSIRHCCLGVLAEQCAAAGAVSRTISQYDSVWFDGNGFLLTPTVADWAGIPENMRSSPSGPSDPVDIKLILPDGSEQNASLLNDGDPVFARRTFDEIADAIERTL